MKKTAGICFLILSLISCRLTAADETKSVRINNPTVNSFIIVQDDKFQPAGQVLSINGAFINTSLQPWYAAYSTCNFSSKAIFEFGLDETKKFYHATAFKTTLTFNAIAYDKDNNPTYYNGQTLQLFYDPAKGSAYADKAFWTADNIYFLDVDVTSIITTENSVVVDNPVELYIEGRIHSSRDYQQEQFTSNKANLFDRRYISASNELELYWPTLTGAEEYELEWCWVHNYPNDPQFDPYYDFRTNATHVLTKNNFYRIPLIYENGHMIFRVRPVGRDCNDNGRGRLPGIWNTDLLAVPDRGLIWSVAGSHPNITYVVSKFENDKFNWSSSLTFDENGRQGSGVSLMDALLKPHYNIAKLNTENQIITSSQLYDFQGRPAVQVLPVPLEKPDISYVAGMNKTSGGANFDKLQFDIDGTGCGLPNSPQIANTGNGAATYYSPNAGAASLQSDKEGPQAYLPDAAQFPYVRTEYTADLTGRIKSQSQPGEVHKTGSGKETKLYYANPGNRELDRLFGTEVGTPAHYSKIISKDANGQLSVSYLDMQDRVIATALTGESPAQVDTLSSYAAGPVALTDDLITKNTSSPYELVVNSSIFVEQGPQTQQFAYEFTPINVNQNCSVGSSLCFSCIYELEISIKDECGTEYVDFNPAATGNQNTQVVGTVVNPGTCATPVKFSIPASTFSIVFPGTGTYYVSKKLRISDVNVEDYWTLYRTLCYKDLSTLLTEQTSLIESSLCGAATCAACTTAVDNYVSAHPGVLNTGQVDRLKNDCMKDCDEDPCRHYKLQMMADLTPNSIPAGQYAQGNSSAQRLSIWGGSNGLVNYQNVTFHEADGSVSQVKNTAGNLVPANQLSISEFTASFRASWAEDLLPFHPEYCYYEFCQQNKASTLYDQAMQSTDTWSAACTAGFLRPMGTSTAGCLGTACPNCATGNPDPFFVSGSGNSIASIMLSELTAHYNSNATYAVTMSTATANFLSLFPGGAGTQVNTSSTLDCAYELAAEAITGTTTGYCTGVSTLHQDNVWKAFRALYLTKKARMYELKRRENAAANGCLNTCIGGGPAAVAITYSNTCYPAIPTSKEGNCNTDQGYNPSLDTKAVCSACGSCAASFQDYTGKTRVFPDVTDILIMGPQDYANSIGGPGTPTALVTPTANPYIDHCTNLAPGWMQKVVDCTQGQVSPTSNTTIYNDVMNNLIAVCSYGSNELNPLGTTDINSLDEAFATTNLGPAVSWPAFGPSQPHYNSFQEVFDHYLFAYTGCSNANDLITFPDVQGQPSYMGKSLDACACTQIMNNQYWFTQMQTYSNPISLPAGVTDGASLWSYYAVNGIPTQNYNFNRPELTNYNLLLAACQAESSGSWNPINGLFQTAQKDALKQYGLEIPSSIGCCYPGHDENPPLNKQFLPCNITADKAFLPAVENTTTCIGDMIDQAYANAQALFDAQMKDKEKFIKFYKQNCMALSDEKFQRDYTLHEHHYTLYYYDQAGNLTRTVPPAGVQPITSSASLGAIDAYRSGSSSTPVFPTHTYPSQYKYTSYNTAEASSSPDEDDKTEYIYDYAGRILASWNPNQKAQGQYVFSYTLYDELSRLIEVGQLNTNSDPAPLSFITLQSQVATQVASFTPTSWYNLLWGKTRNQVTRTFYNTPEPSVQWYFSGGQKNLRNRISYVQYLDNGTTVDHSSYFSYDAHGNVAEVVKQVEGFYKKIEYEYDLISGNVNKITYQRDCKDQLVHKYYYDADNRLHEVYTSKNGIIFERDAKYFYYRHGALARTELGDVQVNGMDYAYTIQGWLKGMNSAILGPDKDMGKDGGSGNHYLSASAGVHSYFAKDGAGYVLNYYDSQSNVYAKDYYGIRSASADYAFTAGESNLRTGSNASFDLLSDAPDLYNGNISSMVSNYLNQNPASTAGIDNYAPQIAAFKYDQLNRLKKMKAFRDIAMNVLSGSYNKWNVPAAGNYDGSYEQQITYDANGNITGLLRKGAGTLVASGTGGLSMDNMTYYYNTPVNAKQTNRLIGINDQAASSYSDDVHQTNVPTAGVSSTYNYDYDRRGNLVLDKSEHIAAIVWTSDGKVKSILRDNQPIAGSSPAAYPPDIDYQYDPMRQRVCKIVKPRSSGTAPGPQANWIYTYYIRDASGQVMAIYEKTFEMVSGQPHTYREKIVTKELSLYGTQRLGADNPGYTDYGNNFTAGTNTLTGEFTNITYASFSLFTPPLNLYSNARILGNKTFELANHLGNVLATVSDRKIAAANTGPGSYLVNYVMSSLPGSLDLVRVNGTDAISGAKLMCMINAVSSPAVFNLRLGSNLPAGDAYEIEFDFDKGTLSGNDQVWALAQEQGTLLPFYLPGGNAHFFFNGTIPPTGHYKFYYKPQATGTGTISSLCFYVVNAQANNFLLDNVTMRALPKVSAYNPDVLSHTDYYAGGAPMPGRRYSSSSYRYGMNGQEKDDEIATGLYTAEFWEYDSRIGRRWNTDPVVKPWESPYACFNNNPIYYADPSGLDGEGPNGECPGDKKVITAADGHKSTYEYIDNNTGWRGQGMEVQLGDVTVKSMPDFVVSPNSVDNDIANNGIDNYAPQKVNIPDGSTQWEKDFAQYNYDVETNRWNGLSYEEKWREAYKNIMMGQLSDFARKAAEPIAQLYTIQAMLGGSGYNTGPALYSAPATNFVLRAEMTIIERAEIGVGNFGLGTATHADAIAAGTQWVGPGARVASDGKTLISSNGLRQFRPPSYKPKLGITQANFESRAAAKGAWQSNGHLDVK